jgi:hypothetical protein
MSKEGKKRNYVYLAGQINENPDTYEWRERFTKLVAKEPGIVVVNPCANRWNKSMRGEGKDGFEFVKRAARQSQRILRAKDYQMVKMSNVMVVHLGFSTPEKPMVGTIQELAWANDIFYTPVIAILSGKNDTYSTHPWIDECCSAKVNTVEEAVDMLKLFFLDY